MKKYIALILACAAAFSLVACSSNGSADSNAKETIVLGTSADYPPYEFKKNIDGKDQFVGFDIDIAKKIAEDLDMELEIVDMPFKSLLLELEAGKIDFVVSGLAYSAERAEKYDLSEPYYDVTQCVVTLKDNTSKFNSIESLVGEQVGAQLGTIQEQIVGRVMPESQSVSMDKVPNLILDLKAGNIKAIVLEEPVAKIFVAKNPDLAISFDVEDHTRGTKVIAVKKGNTELLENINSTVTQITTDGTFDSFMENALKLAAEE